MLFCFSPLLSFASFSVLALVIFALMLILSSLLGNFATIFVFLSVFLTLPCFSCLRPFSISLPLELLVTAPLLPLPPGISLWLMEIYSTNVNTIKLFMGQPEKGRLSNRTYTCGHIYSCSKI